MSLAQIISLPRPYQPDNFRLFRWDFWSLCEYEPEAAIKLFGPLN